MHGDGPQAQWKLLAKSVAVLTPRLAGVCEGGEAGAAGSRARYLALV